MQSDPLAPLFAPLATLKGAGPTVASLLAKAAGGARVIMVSSAAHVDGGVQWHDVNFERRSYDPWTAYAQSKTANVLFAVGAAHRWEADRIAVSRDFR